MGNLKGRVAAAIVAFGLVGVGGTRAGADVIIDFEQVGANVVSTLSGSLSVNGVSTQLNYVGSGTVTIGVQGDVGVAVLGTPTSGSVDVYKGLSGPATFGTGGAFAPTSGTGVAFGVYESMGYFLVPKGFVSSAALSATDTFDGQTLATLGLTVGTYTYTFPAAIGTESITVEIGANAVATPEPSTLVFCATGAVALAVARVRRRRA